MFHSGVGHEAVAARDLVTDPVYPLQSGKTAPILRFAAESADLLSDFRIRAFNVAFVECGRRKAVCCGD